MAPQPGQPAPLLQYFSILLEKGKLNEQESVELCRPVIQQGRQQMITNWMSEDKLAHSEALGDILLPVDMGLALTVYIGAGSHDKVTLIEILAVLLSCLSLFFSSGY